MTASFNTALIQEAFFISLIGDKAPYTCLTQSQLSCFADYSVGTSSAGLEGHAASAHHGPRSRCAVAEIG